MIRIGMITGALALIPPILPAQTIQQAWWSTDGGGTTQSVGGNLVLRSTIGQPDAERLSFGTLVLSGGVQHPEVRATKNPINGLSAVPGPDRVYLQWRTVLPSAKEFLVERRTTGVYQQLAVIPTAPNGENSYLDVTAVSGTVYTYQISQMLTGGIPLPRGTIAAKPYSTTVPGTMARVGPGGYASIAAAISAAPVGQHEWIVSVQPGNYSSFTVGPAAPDVLRIISDGTGKVSIDSRTGPIKILQRTAGQTVELRGLQIGTPWIQNTAIDINGCTGVVLIDSTTTETVSNYFGLIAVNSTSVAVQNSSIGGGIGMLLSNSTVFVSKSSTTGYLLGAQSDLTTAELINTGINSKGTGSTHNVLSGPMPDLGSHPFTAPDFPFDVALDSWPSSSFAVFFARGNGWLELPPIEMVLLLDSAAMVQVAMGSTDVGGNANITLDFSSVHSQLYGRSLELQAVSIDPVTGTVRLSDVLTKIGLR